MRGRPKRQCDRALAAPPRRRGAARRSGRARPARAGAACGQPPGEGVRRRATPARIATTRSCRCYNSFGHCCCNIVVATTKTLLLPRGRRTFGVPHARPRRRRHRPLLHLPRPCLACEAGRPARPPARGLIMMVVVVMMMTYSWCEDHPPASASTGWGPCRPPRTPNAHPPADVHGGAAAAAPPRPRAGVSAAAAPLLPPASPHRGRLRAPPEPRRRLQQLAGAGGNDLVIQSRIQLRIQLSV
jgi:hypothetical protein